LKKHIFFGLSSASGKKRHPSEQMSMFLTLMVMSIHIPIFVACYPHAAPCFTFEKTDQAKHYSALGSPCGGKMLILKQQ